MLCKYTIHIFYVKYKDTIMKSIFCHEIEDIHLNDKKSTRSTQVLQDNTILRIVYVPHYLVLT